MNIKGAIFDMDGTLVDSLMYWDYLWEALAQKYSLGADFRPDPQTEKDVRTLTMNEGMHLLYERCGIGESGEELAKIAADLCEHFYLNVARLKNGVREYLSYLKSNGVKMCIASAATRPFIELALGALGIADYFLEIISCEEVGCGKEHPDVYICAHEFLGTPKDETWIFEDSVVAVETAVAAGYNTVGIYDKYNFNHDRVKEISTVYIAEGETLLKLAT